MFTENQIESTDMGSLRLRRGSGLPDFHNKTLPMLLKTSPIEGPLVAVLKKPNLHFETRYQKFSGPKMPSSCKDRPNTEKVFCF